MKTQSYLINQLDFCLKKKIKALLSHTTSNIVVKISNKPSFSALLHHPVAQAKATSGKAK